MEISTTMTAEFATNCKLNIKHLTELFKAYDLAKLGYDMQEQQAKECRNEALRDTPFYATESSDRHYVKAGDRVTDEGLTFLLSDEDFDRFQALTLPILEREGITDADGYYTTDWLKIKGDARRALVDFILDNIVPQELNDQLSEVRINVVQAWKLLDVIRPIVAV